MAPSGSKKLIEVNKEIGKINATKQHLYKKGDIREEEEEEKLKKNEVNINKNSLNCLPKTQFVACNCLNKQPNPPMATIKKIRN